MFMPEQNGTLRQYLDKLAEPLYKEAQTTMIRQLVFGLCYLHEHKVAHRDFKSPNVLLDAG
jgi:serine/threonine protein kinase